MGTTAKALKLLNLFSVDRPEIGLTEFAKLAGYDKATTHRRLNDLAECGFVEQDPGSRAYRLGPAVLRLAYLRERTFPAREAAMPALQALARATSETVHLSLIQGHEGLSTLAHIGSTAHGMRVYVDEAEILPFHATASGIAVLAYSAAEFTDEILGRALEPYTDDTVTDLASLRRRIDSARSRGFGYSDGGFEPGVFGLAAPVFDHNGLCNGAIAVATPQSRIDDDTRTAHCRALVVAASAITTAWGGQLPDHIQAAWADAPAFEPLAASNAQRAGAQ